MWFDLVAVVALILFAKWFLSSKTEATIVRAGNSGGDSVVRKIGC